MSTFFTHLAVRSFAIGKKSDMVRPRLPALFAAGNNRRQAVDPATTGEETLQAEVAPGKQTTQRDDTVCPHPPSLSATNSNDRQAADPATTAEKTLQAEVAPGRQSVRRDETIRPYPPPLSATGSSDRQAADPATTAEKTLQRGITPGKQAIQRDLLSQPNAAPPAAGHSVVSAESGKNGPDSTVAQAHQKTEKNLQKTLSTEESRQRLTARRQSRRQPAPGERAAVSDNPYIGQKKGSIIPADAPKPAGPTVVHAEELFHSRANEQNLLLHSGKPRAIQPQTPAINVTIGRVEVRAMTRQTAPVKAPRPSPAPALSLNDYLKQRQEGRR